MKWIRGRHIATGLVATALAIGALTWTDRIPERRLGRAHPAQGAPALSEGRWIVSAPVFSQGVPGTFDDLAIRDPSLVYYEGRYHLFYTSRAARANRGRAPHPSRGGSGLGHASAASLEGLNSAPRHDLGVLFGDAVTAPQVFYFRPHGLWYLFARTPARADSAATLVYLTNADIDDVRGWSEPTPLRTGRAGVDYWVICDDEKAHLFRTDDRGGIARMEVPLSEFPGGLATAPEERVPAIRNRDEDGRRRMHRASRVYYVAESGEYLNLLDVAYRPPAGEDRRAGRDRVILALVADSLEGPWRRVATLPHAAAAGAVELVDEEGERSPYDQLGPFELIRAGHDQRFETDDFRLDLLFQALDTADLPDVSDDRLLPWELVVVRNYR